MSRDIDIHKAGAACALRAATELVETIGRDIAGTVLTTAIAASVLRIMAAKLEDEIQDPVILHACRDMPTGFRPPSHPEHLYGAMKRAELAARKESHPPGIRAMLRRTFAALCAPGTRGKTGTEQGKQR